MQIGISMSEFEIKELIRERVARLTGTEPDDLEVFVTCWNGRLNTCTTLIEGGNLSFKDAP